MMYRLPSRQTGLYFIFAALFLCPDPQQASATTLHLAKVTLVSRVREDRVATPDYKTSSPNHPIILHVVVEGQAPGRLPTYFTEAPVLDMGWGPIPKNQVRPWDPARDGDIDIQWTAIEPEARAYDNLVPQFHFEPIHYQEVPLPAAQGKWTWEASVHPTLLPDPAPALATGLGVGRFKVVIKHGEVRLASPGGAGSLPGGLSDHVTRVSYRGLDTATLVSWAQARFNIPYISGSARRGKGDGTHQAMVGVGTDSVDLLVAGWRMAGHTEVDFVGPFLLDPAHDSRSTVQVARCKPTGDIYQTLEGEPVTVGPGGILPGDLIRSTKQAGIFARDLPPVGSLSDGDMVISALFREPCMEALRDSLSGPITILRWNEIREAQKDLQVLNFYSGPVDGIFSPALDGAVRRFRSEAGLPPLDADLAALLGERDGASRALPIWSRFEMLRSRFDRIKADEADLRPFTQRLLSRAADALGADGEGALPWLPPREGMPQEAWSGAIGARFIPTDVTPWNLEETYPRIVQTFPVADADRDGTLDLTGSPVPIRAPGPGLILSVERGWAAKRPSEGSRILGNQVWLYLPRADILVAFLGMGEIGVKEGDRVGAGTVLGMVGRTGKIAGGRRDPTRGNAAAFSWGTHGRLLPVDLTTRWGQALEANPLSSRVFVPQNPVNEAPPGGMGEPTDPTDPKEPADPGSIPPEKEKAPTGRLLEEVPTPSQTVSAHP